MITELSRPQKIHKLPYFLRQITWPEFGAFFLSCIVAYFFMGMLFTSRAIVMIQVGILLIPSLVFLKIYQSQNYFLKKDLLIHFVIVSVLAVLITILNNKLLPYWVKIVPPPESLQKVYKSMSHQNRPYGVFLDIFQLAIIPAICEEFFFRGSVLIALKQKMKVSFAIFISSAVFALIHLNVSYMPFYFLLGIFFGLTFLLTKNLWFSIWAHFINNFIAVLIMHYPVVKKWLLM